MTSPSARLGTTEMGDEPRPGSYADLARRVDRLEQTVGNLSGTVARVEQNQAHAEDLNKLRFDALDLSMKTLQAKLDNFVTRIEGLITGEVQTAQTREAQERIRDYEEWRSGVNEFMAQTKLVGRLANIAIGGNLLALAAAIYALVK